MRRPNRWLGASLLAAFGGLIAGGVQAAAPSAPAPAPAPAENLVVHGQKRFSPAPMPNQEIHDPADQLRDPNTGTSMNRFGRAYIDANPVPPINPGLKGDQSPIAVGVQR